ncbi:DUF3131 domain-containing protein [Burkholderia sp. BCC1993]|uniref:DUF3131 domain-containing protein n=1 Tax=Burkholderia sp. BCC1993 TaxID=2817444 RepID=UPI002AB06582|nr:DUF3131 domain-containing protein [Burkholderia sp. BCC1993]
MSAAARFARAWAALALLASALLIFPAARAQSTAEYAPLAPGWAAYQDGRFAEAAQRWGRTSADDETRPDTLPQAAFAAVLTAFARERAGDARAADSWARAMRLYARAGDSWPRYRDALATEVARIRSAGDAMAAPGAPAAVPPFLRMIAALDDRDRLLSYDGPRAAAAGPAPARESVGIGMGYLGAANAGERTGPAGSVYSNLAAAVAGPEVAVRVPGLPAAAPSVAAGSPSITLRGDGEAAFYRAALHADREDDALAASTCEAGPASLPAGEWQAAAADAWSYVVANRQAGTGLVNGKHGYPYITTSDIAGTLAALIAANQLGLASALQTEAWLRQVLATLRDLPRYGGELPARQYDARTGSLVDLDNNASLTGSGYNLYEIARVLVWLQIAAACYPDLRADALAARDDWKFARATSLGRLHSVLALGGIEQIYVDEPLGYKEYAAAALTLAGLPIPGAFSYAEARERTLENGPVWYDAQPASLPTSDPFILGTIELGGIDGCFRTIARMMYEAQGRHAARLGRPVALGAEVIDRPPWFSFSTVYAGDTAWKAASYDMQADATLRVFSAKAAFGWAAIFPDRYAKALLAGAMRFARAGGVSVGAYESNGMVDATSLDTNAQVLEAAWYVARGRRSFLPPVQAGPADCPAPSREGPK